MSVRQASGRGMYGASLAFGALAAIEFIFLFFPKVRPLGRVLEVVQLYLERLHPALGSIVGPTWVGQLVTTCLLVWIASWAALEAFSRTTDGVSLWANIAEDSCGLEARGLKRITCAACKWAFTFAAAPVLIMLALVRRVRYGTSNVTVGFVSFDPGIVMKYIKHLLMGVALVSGAALLVIGTG